MTYDEGLVERVRDVLAVRPDVREKKMFGGHGFLVDGALACSASSRGGLMVRVPEAEAAGLTAQPHVAPFEMRGRTMRGWLHVDAAGLDDEELRDWVDRGVGAALASR